MKHIWKLLLAPIAMVCVAQPSWSETRPNVVLILADDLGWKDVGYHGSEIQTPVLDDLAETGVRLNRYYVQPTCSPTRASLLTGQSSVRLGFYQPLSKLADKSVPLELTLLPEYFQKAGYQTIHIGKWHLGRRTRAMLPNARGFDHSYGYLTGGVGYWNHVHGGGLDWNRNGKTIREEGYSTRLLADEAVRQIKERDKSKPLFMYYTLPAPHLPNEAPEETIANYSDLKNPKRRIHAAMVEEFDTAIGQVIRALEEEGIRDNTLIWFSSDNGGLNIDAHPEPLRKTGELLHRTFGENIPIQLIEFIRSNVMDAMAVNAPYRRGKGSTYEGGTLVPAIVHWPGKLSPRQIDARLTVQDVLPTLAAVAGLEIEQDRELDGANQWNTLVTGTSGETPDFIVNGYEGLTYYSGDWKVIPNGDGFELYNLSDDPYEQQNRAESEPNILADLIDRRNAFPKGDSIHVPIWKVLLDPDFFGGPEDRAPWADIVED